MSEASPGGVCFEAAKAERRADVGEGAVATVGAASRARGAWAALALIALAELLGMSLWFTASAVSPHFRAVWNLSAEQAGALTTVVQLGFVTGTAAAAGLNLADLLPSRGYFAVAALLAALANATVVVAPGFGVALLLRFLTGAFLAGVYPPAMKMAATWFRAGRGVAIGTVVGALTVGKAAPYLVKAVEGAEWRAVVLASSAGAVLAAVLVGVAYRDGPFAFPRRPFSLRLAGRVLRHRETRLATLGYLGHMWELYAMWTLVSLFFADVFMAHGVMQAQAAAWAALCAFAAIAVGGIGSVLAGAWADRLGRERVTIGAMAVSGACALVMGHLLHAPVPLVLAFGLLWGFAVVADSAQFSAVVTEVAPSHAVGTALTLQTSLGFLLTAASIALAIALRTRFGWATAFGVLAAGPALGIVAMARLRRVRAAREAGDE